MITIVINGFLGTEQVKVFNCRYKRTQAQINVYYTRYAIFHLKRVGFTEGFLYYRLIFCNFTVVRG